MRLIKGSTFTSTRDTKLAAALVSMKVMPFDGEPTQKIKDLETGKEYILWKFETVSSDGVYKTSDLVNWFYDDEWFEENQDHPFTYVIAGLRNREALLDVISNMRGTLKFRNDGQLWYIPEDGKMHRMLWDEKKGLNLPEPTDRYE